MIKNKLFLLCAVVSILINSCKDTSVSRHLLDLFDVKEESVVESIFPDLKNDVLNPEMIVTDSDNLYIYESKADTLVSVLTKNGVLSRKILLKGQGAYEVVYVNCMGFAAGKCYFMDFSQKKVLFWDNDSKKFFADTALNSYVLNHQITTTLGIDDDLRFFANVGSDKRFSCKSSDTVVQFGQIDDYRGVNAEQISWGLQGPLVINPIRKRLFWVSWFSDAYDVYDYTSLDNVVKIKSELTYLASNELDENMGALNITCNNDYVFVLYSGKSDRGVMDQLYTEEEEMLSDNILVFDWDGTPVKVIHTNHLLRFIHFDIYESQLYGIELGDDSEYELCKIPVK